VLNLRVTYRATFRNATDANRFVQTFRDG